MSALVKICLRIVTRIYSLSSHVNRNRVLCPMKIVVHPSQDCQEGTGRSERSDRIATGAHTVIGTIGYMSTRTGLRQNRGRPQRHLFFRRGAVRGAYRTEALEGGTILEVTPCPRSAIRK